jgi:hypothetical protein
VRLLRSDTEDAKTARQAWALARDLSHDHLIRLYDSGETEIDGVRFDYAALEHADDDIGEILAGRVLDDDEARAMTLSCGSALAYLHDRSLQHGAVTPSNMFIIGEEVKLGIDALARADDEGIAFDLQQFGVSLARALEGTTKPESAYVLRKPFREIAVGCEDPHRTGWTAPQIVDTIEGRKRPEPQSGIVERLRALLLPLPGGARPGWVIAGVGVIALAAAFAYRGAHSSAAPPKTPPPPITVSAPATKPSPALSATPPPEAERGNSSLSPEPKVRSGWAVIAATYHSYDSARGRAQQIARRAPHLKPRVYPPAGRSSLYYVVLGSGLTQKEAERLRRTARQSGAPPDTYVTKLKAS